MEKLLIVTTVRQGSEFKEVEKLRGTIFLDTANRANVLNIPILAVYQDCHADYLQVLKDLDVELIEQESEGMGGVRREALQKAVQVHPEFEYYLWMEPEKPGLISSIPSICDSLSASSPVLCLFNRIHMDSYPPEQACYYGFVRAVATALIGFDFDYGFGPMVLTKQAVPYFMSYRSNFGDLWDSILVPRLRVIKSGAPYRILPLDFVNDLRMTRMEQGNSQMILKRIEQLNNVVPSLIAEW
jgi:hypothetical protein